MRIDFGFKTLIFKVCMVTKVRFGFRRIAQAILELSTWNWVQLPGMVMPDA